MEALVYPAAQPSDQVLWFIPGNPGNAAFYHAFASELAELYSARLHVVVSGLSSHSKASAAAQPGARFGLEQQLRAQAAALDSVRLLLPEGALPQVLPSTWWARARARGSRRPSVACTVAVCEAAIVLPSPRPPPAPPHPPPFPLHV